MQRILIVLLFFQASVIQAQIDASLYVDGQLVSEQQFRDSLELNRWVRSYKLDAVSDGYFFVGLDSMIRLNDRLNLYLYKGEKSELMISNSGKKKLRTAFKNRIRYLADHGYPFASVKLDSSEWHDGKLTGRTQEDKGPFVVNDTAHFYSDIATRPGYVHQLIGLVPGDAFNESAYLRADRRILRSTFLRLKRPVDVSFQDGRAKLFLDIAESAANSFQGVVGLQQNRDGGSNLVGSFDLNLQNLFKSGKELGISWESFTGASQQLHIDYAHPFVFATPISPSFSFKLLKQDSIFLQRTTNLGFGTFLLPRIEIVFSYTRQAGSLLTTEVSTLQNSDIADFTSDKYEVRLTRGHLNLTNELRSTHAWQVGMGLGTKRIDNNVSLADTFYDTLQLKTDLFQFDLKAVVSQRIWKRQTIFQRVEIGLIDNDELLDNDRFRLGGLRSLRGFDEKEFFVERYALSRTEFRSYFEKGSYLYLFYDQALVRSRGDSDHPFGAGVGFTLATLSGQFNFALALGRSDSQELDVANMKAHFGYITIF